MTATKNNNSIKLYPSPPSPQDSNGWPCRRAIKLLFCGGGIIVCFGVYSFLQEGITQKRYGSSSQQQQQFVYMQALVFSQCFINFLLSWAVRLLNNTQACDTVPSHLYSLCSISYFLSMLFSNIALQWINYPTQVLGKSCEPIAIMLFGVLLANKRYAMRQYLNVLLIGVGMAIFMYKPAAHRKDGGDDGTAAATKPLELGTGKLLLIASLAMDGVTGAVQDRIRRRHTIDKWTMLFAMNGFASFFLALLLVGTGELAAFFRFIAAHPYVLNEIGLFALAGAIGQCFVSKMITDFGPLTCSIVITLRKLFTLVFSILLFAHPYTRRHIIGIVLVFGALMLDAMDTRRGTDDDDDDQQTRTTTKQHELQQAELPPRRKYGFAAAVPPFFKEQKKDKKRT